MDDLRVFFQHLGFDDAVDSVDAHDRDTLSILNEEVTAQLRADPKYIRFKEWMLENGARFPDVDFPVAFGHHGELMGLAANKDIPPMRGFLFIPDKLMITAEKARKDPVLGPIIKKHPELFEQNQLINETTEIVVFLMQ